jgi:DUF1365 family protein
VTRSAIYAGDVVHVRHRPRRHRLHYRVFSLLIDLDELPALSARSRVFGYNRPALFSFHDADHGDGVVGRLRPWVEARLAEAGIDSAAPGISVLCYPRIFNYVFNPLTLYFCSDRSGRLRAVLDEVCNTQCERHIYGIAAAESDVVRQTAPKLHFVSPFVPMACRYDFLIRPPEDRVLVRIEEADREGPLLVASFAGRRRDWTDKALWQVFFSYPLMTFKVTAAIHWEALKLLLKGLPVFAHHPAPRHVVSTHHPAGDRQPERVG